MSKKLGIIAILVVFMIAGTIPFVMGADSTAVDPVLEPKIQSLSQVQSIDSSSVRSLSQIQSTDSSVSDFDVVPLYEDNWYYGEVDDVWPWMQSDYTTFNLIDLNGNIYTFKVKPASTDDNGWNNAFMQNQIVYCLISADTNKHKINVHVDENNEVDQVRLADTEITGYPYFDLPEDIQIDVELPEVRIPEPISVVDSVSGDNV